MTSSDLIVDSGSVPEIDVADMATRLLRDWCKYVRRLPQLMSTVERKRAVRDLVVWYEQVYEQKEFAIDAPIQGLDALVDELSHVAVPLDVHAALARGRWAIRVAEELVKWWSCLHIYGECTPPTGRATDRLELAIEGARRQLVTA